MTKQELLKKIESMENEEFYDKKPDASFVLKLSKNVDEDSRDLEEMTPNLFEQHIDLLLDCYNREELLIWLENQEFNPIKDFGEAEIYKKDDVDSQEEWDNLVQDALFYDEDEKIIVRSW